MTDVPQQADAGESATTPIRILHLTDLHFLAEGQGTMLGVDTEQSFKDVLDAALAALPNPDLMLLTGDLVQDAEPSAYRRLKRQLANLPCPAYCLPGNHDDPALIATILADDPIFFQPRILFDGWQIICLDSTIPHQPCGRLAPAQLQQLETLLAEYPHHHTLIAMHHHALPSGSVWMDTMVVENADRFFHILDQNPQVRGIVCGHVHQEIDRQHGTIRLLATPSTCFQFKPGQVDFALDAVPPGYRWIELYPEGRLETGVERLPELPAGLDMGSNGY